MKINNSHSQTSASSSSKPTQEITIGEYILKQTIGEGAFSKVKLAVHIPTNSVVAIKILDKSKICRDDKIRITREIKILTQLNHPNIIQVNEIFENKDSYFIVMEYCPEGELFNYIVHKKRLPEEEASFIFFQIINGLEYIHNNNISHRDLKPENILLLANRTIKIIDFGLSNFYYGKLLKTPCGSPCYAAPEMIKNKSYDGRCIDIWSVGIIVFAMVCGYLPFEDKNNQKLFHKILNNQVTFPHHVSLTVRTIVKKMLCKDPGRRITIPNIKNSQFYLQGKTIYNIKFSTTYDDLNIIKYNNTAAGSINNMTKELPKNEDIFIPNLTSSDCENEVNLETENAKSNEEELIYEKEVMPTFEPKAPTMPKIVNYTALHTLESIPPKTHRKTLSQIEKKEKIIHEQINEESKQKENEDSNNISVIKPPPPTSTPQTEKAVKKGKLIKVNKRHKVIKHQKYNSYNPEIVTKVPPINLENAKNLGGTKRTFRPINLLNYSMFKNKIALTKRVRSNKKPQIATLINVGHKNSEQKRDNGPINMTFYNVSQGFCDTSLEIDDYLSNRKERYASSVHKNGNPNVTISENKNLLPKRKRRMNQSIDQDSIIEKFYKKFNLKINYPQNPQLIFSSHNKRRKTDMNEYFDTETNITKCGTYGGINEKRNYYYTKIKTKISSKLNKSIHKENKDKINKKVCELAKTVISLKEKMNSYRPINTENNYKSLLSREKNNSQIKQKTKVIKIK